MARRGGAPEVNAGSMADIAFLLLIFFLVTTTIETDSGLDRKLPPIDTPETDVIIKQKNIFTVEVNKNNQLLVEEELMELKDLRAAAVKFLDNGGGVGETGEQCDYCRGDRDPSSSDHPNKAVISLRNDRMTKYSTYIAVQNELVAAYNELRNREAQRLFNRPFTAMEAEYLDPKTSDGVKDELKPKIERIQAMYPQKLSEAEPKSN
ncbi:biopolymer transporter ExbD [Robertkochia marina]|uniref:Biopolymer transporter ExbD n=1 Tax=Robertkochia marina TaxID=1227945 RepID=A0A4S3M1Z0_9FLAO|nr:biopolymer transporter ExbD [Robertkochia marina]THD69033.1 biopolymer transporter ExbD [Robertkochia marina]TRZ44856.1 biopolymer transporter ExbD [Robertkochia marina]